MSLKKLLTYFNIPMILRKSFAPKLYIWKQHELNTHAQIYQTFIRGNALIMRMFTIFLPRARRASGTS